LSTKSFGISFTGLRILVVTKAELFNRINPPGMKSTYSLISVTLFIVLYYLVWTLTLPFFIARLFLNAAAGDDDEIAMTRFKN